MVSIALDRQISVHFVQQHAFNVMGLQPHNVHLAILGNF